MPIIEHLKTTFSSLERAFERFALGSRHPLESQGQPEFRAELYQLPAAWRRRHRHPRTLSRG